MEDSAKYKNIKEQLRNRLFLMHTQSKLLTMISDIEEELSSKIIRLQEMEGKIAAAAELCRIEECFITDYEMLMMEKNIIEEGIQNDKGYLEELIAEYNECEAELREL